ncbi:MAG: NUDIX hydrolase [Simkaniaceae bacterium]|nr:NUDIX hydrolase [Simkaniaceae bacterium]
MSSQESVKGILFDQGKFLMILRKDCPVWVLPGGGIDEGETPEAAIIREFEEETGLKVSIVRKIAHYLPINRLTRPTHFYELTSYGGALSIQEETRAVQFFDLTSLPKKTPPPFPDWIRDALENHKEVLIKKITSTSYLVFFKHLVLHPLLIMRFILSRLGYHYNSN